MIFFIYSPGTQEEFVKIFYGIADADAFSRGGGNKLTSGNGNRVSPNPRLDSTRTTSAGIFYGRGLLVYSLPT